MLGLNPILSYSSVDGKMIDIPVVDRARRLLKRHDAIERRLKKT
jgi:citrate lyase subunit beta/citryl-CoA lyase